MTEKMETFISCIITMIKFMLKLHELHSRICVSLSQKLAREAEKVWSKHSKRKINLLGGIVDLSLGIASHIRSVVWIHRWPRYTKLLAELMFNLTWTRDPTHRVGHRGAFNAFDATLSAHAIPAIRLLLQACLIICFKFRNYGRYPLGQPTMMTRGGTKLRGRR